MVFISNFRSKDKSTPGKITSGSLTDALSHYLYSTVYSHFLNEKLLILLTCLVAY